MKLYNTDELQFFYLLINIGDRLLSTEAGLLSEKIVINKINTYIATECVL